MNTISFRSSSFFSASDAPQEDALILTARKKEANETEFVTVPNTFFGRTICFFFRDAKKIAEVASADLENKYGGSISQIFKKKALNDLVREPWSKNQVVQLYTKAKNELPAEVCNDEIKKAMEAAEAAEKSLSEASTLGSETQEKRDIIKKCYAEAITTAEKVKELWEAKEKKLQQEYSDNLDSLTACAYLPSVASFELARKERRQADQKVMALIQKELEFTADNIKAWELELADVESVRKALLRAERSQGKALKAIAEMAGWTTRNTHDANSPEQQDVNLSSHMEREK